MWCQLISLFLSSLILVSPFSITVFFYRIYVSPFKIVISYCFLISLFCYVILDCSPPPPSSPLPQGREKRSLHHLHFTGWPDRGSPEDVTGLVEFRHKVHSVQAKMNGPVIVHCRYITTTCSVSLCHNYYLNLMVC